MVGPPSVTRRAALRAPGEWVEQPQYPHQHPPASLVVDEEAGVGADGVGSLPAGASHGTGSASVSRAGSVAGDSNADFGLYGHEWEEHLGEEDEYEEDDEWCVFWVRRFVVCVRGFKSPIDNTPQPPQKPTGTT